MPVEFYNENLFTDFPLLNRQTINTRFIVDATVVFYTNYTLKDKVYLKTYTGNGTSVTLVFGVENSIREFDFTVSNTVTPYTRINSEKSFGSMFIVVGKPETQDFSVSFSSSNNRNVLIPTRVINASQNSVSSIRIANKYTTQYVDSDCDVDFIQPDQTYKVLENNLTGNIEWDWGRYSLYEFQSVGNSIVFEVEKSDSLSRDNSCDIFRVLPDTYDFSNEFSCADLVFSLNGVTADPGSNNLDISARDGVRVLVDEDEPHTLNLVFLPQLENNRNLSGRECLYVMETGEGLIPLKNDLTEIMNESGDTYIKITNKGCYKVRCRVSEDTVTRPEVRVQVMGVFSDLNSCEDCQ